MRVSDLFNGQVVRARWGRAGEEAPDWGPWQLVTLHVQRDRGGKVAIISLVDVAWAEVSPQDLRRPEEGQANAYFIVEDYYLEIEGLTL